MSETHPIIVDENELQTHFAIALAVAPAWAIRDLTAKDQRKRDMARHQLAGLLAEGLKTSKWQVRRPLPVGHSWSPQGTTQSEPDVKQD